MSVVSGQYSQQPAYGGAPAYQPVPGQAPAYGYQAQGYYTDAPPAVPVAQQVIVTPAVNVESCPSCHTVGSFEKDFTCCGIALAIIFFPIGVLCCVLMQETKCRVCGYVLNKHHHHVHH